MSNFTTAPIKAVANKPLSEAAKLAGKQKREYTTYAILGILTMEATEQDTLIARGRLVDIAIEDGAYFDDDNLFIVPEDSPLAGIFNPSDD